MVNKYPESTVYSVGLSLWRILEFCLTIFQDYDALICLMVKKLPLFHFSFLHRARRNLRAYIGDVDAAAVPCGFGRAIGNKVSASFLGLILQMKTLF